MESIDCNVKPNLVWQRLPHESHETAVTTATSSSNDNSSDRRGPFIARPSWPWVVVAVEVQQASDRQNTDVGEDHGKVQQNAYALEMQNRQHRTHAFTFQITGKSARIFRWDRAGYVVSRQIDLKTESQHLLNCIYRLACGGPISQGIDPTAVPASKSEMDKLKSYRSNNQYLMEYWQRMTHPESLLHYPIHKVSTSSTFPHSYVHLKLIGCIDRM